MRIPPQVSSAAIVALGHFNPLILRPDWLKSKEIVVGSDYEALQVDFMHAEIVSLQLPWGRMQCDRNQFMITTVQEPVVAVADFFVKCFQMLPETPMTALGINREIHFPAGSFRSLAPDRRHTHPKRLLGRFDAARRRENWRIALAHHGTGNNRGRRKTKS
jgi:hypothetical protein